MTPVTRLLDAVAAGDPHAASDLLPLVYDELRKLATGHLARERAGHTLQATALVHEAYLRLVGNGQPVGWNGRGHFFGAAARAMRQILVDSARSKASIKRLGNRQQVPLAEAAVVAAPDGPPSDDLLALDEALTRLEVDHPEMSRYVELRYFAGLSVEEAAAALRISESTAKRYWVYAKAWFYGQLTNS